MNTHTPTLAAVSPAEPPVTLHDGKPVTTSRAVAEIFGKEHRNVLRDIDALLAAEPACLLNFEQTPYVEPSTGRTYRMFEITRDGFTLLAMGFTGPQALKWKLAYIEAFNRLEAESRASADPVRLLNDPAHLRTLLLNYTEREAELQGRVEALAPKAEALERIAEAQGSLCITDAAKALQVQPKRLFDLMRGRRWIYRRVGGKSDCAYQALLQTGHLEHKVTTVTRDDGSERVVEQVRVTPKGLVRLAEMLGLAQPGAPLALAASNATAH